MTANDTMTLPGSIPGLLRRGSPVIEHGAWAVVVETEEDCGRFRVYDGGQVGDSSRSVCALDLSDPTGRAHAAWWVLGQSAGPVSKALAALDTSSTYLLGLIDRCCAGSATAFDTEALRRIVLHVAGREGSDV